MSVNDSYEKVVKKSNKGKHLAKKISLALSYAVFFVLWLMAALNNPKQAVYIIVAGALLTLIIAIITWKYLCIEYEYSFSYGTLSVAKIYAKKKRKPMLETEIKELLIIAPATEEYIRKAEHFQIDKRIIAVSSEQAENIWLVVSGGKDERRVLVFFEADDRSLSILKSINPYVFIKPKKAE